MTLAVISHLGALLIASFMLPIMDVIYETGGDHMELSPHTSMPLMVEISWILSNVVGILLFMLGLCLVLRVCSRAKDCLFCYMGKACVREQNRLSFGRE